MTRGQNYPLFMTPGELNDMARPKNTPADVEPADLTDPAPVPAAAPPVPAAEDRTAALERQFEDLSAKYTNLLDRLADTAKTTAVPPGYRIVKDEPTAAERDAELAAAEREISRSTQERSQEAAFKQYPEGRHVYRVNLPDKNRHPELAIRADNETDAKARYLAVCGVRSTETELTVSRV